MSIANARSWPASAIAKITVLLGDSRRRSCSGSWLGRRLVLTAAHCLASETALAPPQAIHVLFGLEHGQPQQSAAVTSYVIAPKFRASDHRAEAAADDWALITLDRDLPLRPLVVQEKTYEELLTLSSQKALFQIGYGMERPFSPTLASPCRIGRQAGGAFAFECLSNYGYSGAPILAGTGETVVIVGVVSRRSEAGSQGFASALSDLNEP